MASLARLADVQISLRTTGIREQSFSDMLILGDHALAVGRTMILTNADDLLDMGLASTDPLYLAAQSAFSQIPSVPQVYIGRRACSSVTVGITAVGGVYRVTVGWRTSGGDITSAVASYTAQAGDTMTLVAAGLVTAINALGATVSASSSGGTVTVAANPSGSQFSVSGTGNLSVSVGASTEPVADALAACMAETAAWYGLILTSVNTTDILAAAAWAESHERLFATDLSNVNNLDGSSTTSVAHQLKTGQYARTAWQFHAKAGTNFFGAGWMSKMFTYYPGSETWANQKLNGVMVDALTEAQYQAVKSKNGNTYELFRDDFAATQNGKVAAGEWIDIIRFRDWLVEQVRINVVSAIINADKKIPYTDHGIQIIRSAIVKALNLGVARGGIAPPELDKDGNVIPSYTVTVPRAASVSANDKANRVLNDAYFTARLTGAIHLGVVKGSLSYVL